MRDLFVTTRPLDPRASAHGIRSMVAPTGRGDWGDRALRRTWRSLGALCFTIGVVNAFIPLLPTTIFLIMGLWAYGKGDPDMRDRLLAHPRFGPSLQRWIAHRQISRKGKLAAIGGIAMSAIFTAVLIGPKPITWAIVGGLALLSAYLATRAEPASLRG